MTTPKKKPTAKPHGIFLASASAIKEAEDWKTSVDMTLSRHGKEINELTKYTHRRFEEAHDSIRSHSGHIREIRESLAHHRTILTINLALIFGLIVAVAYLINR